MCRGAPPMRGDGKGKGERDNEAARRAIEQAEG